MEVDGSLKLLEGAHMPHLHVFFALLSVLDGLDSELPRFCHFVLEGNLVADLRLIMPELLH